MDIYNYFNNNGPFQISQGKVYIKQRYVPYTFGSYELEEIINARLSRVNEEQAQWQLLADENQKLMEHS
tara:strand:- start:324 stop:530 length:207 start_codon:yes stop_codon:yes gene_type:complete